VADVPGDVTALADLAQSLLKDGRASHGADSSTPLVDPEGYPRADIDIYSIRHTRAALNRLHTDRQTVSDRLAPALEAAFAPRSASSNGAGPSTGASMTNGYDRYPTTGHILAKSDGSGNEPEWPDRPVARVNSVADGSPAATAGLLARDLVYSFAGVTVASEGGLQAIGAVVSRSEGTPLELLVMRGEGRIRMSLTPRNGWGGRGSLGCHILPA